MEIESILPLYIRNEIWAEDENGIHKGILDAIYVREDEELMVNIAFASSIACYIPARTCKLLLRPLSDMTAEEQKEYNHHKQKKGHTGQIQAENTLWLTKKGFDIFGLIDLKLAIDKTKL